MAEDRNLGYGGSQTEAIKPGLARSGDVDLQMCIALSNFTRSPQTYTFI